MSVNHHKYTLVIVDEYSRMVENQNDVKVKQIRTDNGTEFKNSELERFYVEKGISQNLSSPYTPEQNGVAKRKNITLIEAVRTMLNGSDHLSRFDAKADDEYFLGYSFNSKAFRVFKTRRQQIEETYHVTFDEIPDVPQSHISNQASISSHHVPQDRWSKGQHIKLMNIIGDPVARMEAIRIFLAFATYMNFIVFQMDVKSAFLNGKIKEEVYVKQPPSFKSSEFPDYVCKLDKALYGLKQAHKACMMGELTYFLRLQIKQDDTEISICQEQYTRNLLKKYEISDCSLVKTPIVPPNNLGPDLAGKLVNETSYKGMIESLMYIIATRPDI
ncbi:retrovirus-related pol polyprotein from transposon TNT 1-94 [Tanacetum coccineum]